MTGDLYSAKSPANHYGGKKLRLDTSIWLDGCLFKLSNQGIAKRESILNRFQGQGVSGHSRDLVEIDVHAASQDEVSKRQGCHAAVAQLEMNEAPFQIDAGRGRCDPASTFGHLTPCHDHVQRRNRAGRHFRQHRREHQMVIAADDDDLNRLVEVFLQMLGQRYPGKAAADNNYGKRIATAWFHRRVCIHYGLPSPLGGLASRSGKRKGNSVIVNSARPTGRVSIFMCVVRAQGYPSTNLTSLAM